MKFGSLFSGIGGIDLGLYWAGMQVAWQSEIDPYCSQVLARRWPDVPNLGDIKKIEWSKVEQVDLIAGGYPCQPFSLAGARRGSDDPRHLWPEMLRAISEVQPRYAFLENVYGHLSQGFREVLEDLASVGFDAEWECLPAAAFGAPHFRDRLCVIATRRDVSNANGGGLWEQSVAEQGRSGTAVTSRNGKTELVADADGATRGGSRTASETVQRPGRRSSADTDHSLNALALLRIRHYEWWATEPSVGRVAHGIPHRVDRLKGLGNAVVPAMAEFVGRCIIEAAA